MLVTVMVSDSVRVCNACVLCCVGKGQLVIV